MSWDFLQRYDESWIWRHVDRNTVTESSRNFAKYAECQEDAARHGYVAPAADRRAQKARSASGKKREAQAARA